MDINKEIKIIQQRNKRVEAEKAWEVSWLRITLICAITYATTAIVFAMIGVKYYMLNAFIPTIGFLLSTLSLPPVKKRWINRRLIK
jgi:hypothetical protein